MNAATPAKPPEGVGTMSKPEKQPDKPPLRGDTPFNILDTATAFAELEIDSIRTTMEPQAYDDTGLLSDADPPNAGKAKEAEPTEQQIQNEVAAKPDADPHSTDKMDDSKPEKCHLLSLPRELRDMIYGYVNGLQYDTPVEIWGWDLSMAKLLPPICLVNKQLWVEASTFFIEKNVLDVCTDARDMSGWLHSFPDNEGYAAVRKLKLSSELSYEEYSGSYGVEYEPDNLELVARCPNIRNIKLKYRLRNFGWSSEKREKLEDSELDRIWSDLRLSVLFDCKNLEQVKLRYIITSIEHNDGGSYAEDLAERRRGPTPEAVDVMEGIKNLLERGFTERGMNVSVENTSHNILLDLWEEFG